MFSNIKTSKANKELVTQLTSRLNLGPENIIARLAFSYSIAQERKLDLKQMSDSQGKEYNVKVLFGNYPEVYLSMLALHYQINIRHVDLGKYAKMHIDDGLELIDKALKNRTNVTGNDFLINEIEKGLQL